MKKIGSEDFCLSECESWHFSFRALQYFTGSYGLDG